MEKKHKILIIDDSNETVAGLKSYFAGKYTIVTAHDGMEGMKAFEADREGIGLIIADLVMPKICGVTLIEAIKRKAPSLPIIAITGWCPHPEAIATYAKPDLLLYKPFEMEDLDQAVTKLLATKE